MIEINKQKEKIIRVDLGMNILSLVVLIFFFKGWIVFTNLTLNIILIGSYMILSKYGAVFSGIYQANKITRTLNDSLENMEAK